MAFLNPLMLLGVLGVSAPIVIHLLNRRKFQRVAWAAMRFVIASVKKNQRRLRIEDLLLLILRCALLVLLALALSRPTVRGAAGGMFGAGRVKAVLVLDNSGSMSTTDGVNSRMELAKQAADQVLDAMPAGASVALVLATDPDRPLIAEPTTDRALVRRMIQQAEISDRTGNLGGALRESVSILKNDPEAHREVYIFTDRTRRAWRDLGAMRRLLDEQDPKVSAHAVLVGSSEPRNVGVSDLRLASGLAPLGQMARIEVRVGNHGAETVNNVRVGLRVDDRPPVDEVVISSIGPGESQTTSLHVRLTDGGYHTLSAFIAPDHMPADDTRTIAVRAVERVAVLLVDGESGRDPRESESYFLVNALAPVAPVEAGAYFIQPQVITPSELPAKRMDDYDVVVLANVADLSDGSIEALRAFLRRGGGLIVFPGDNTQPEFYNRELFEKDRFLPAAYGVAVGDAQARDTEKARVLQDHNFEHPIAALWNDPASGRPSAASFYRIMPLQADANGLAGRGAASDAGAARVVLSYADGTPAVMERPWGMGRVVQFSSTADTAWNNLPTRAPGVYIPLLHRIIGSIVGRHDEALNVMAGQPLTYRVDNQWMGYDAVFKRPGDADGVRGTSRRLEMKDGGVSLQYDRTDRAGAYSATINTSPPAVIRFAVQADPDESSLDELEPSQAQALGAAMRVIDYKPGTPIHAALAGARSGVELWLAMALVVVLLAGAEMFLAYRFSESK